MGCGNSIPDYNKECVDLSHFEMNRVLGRGGFGVVNACLKFSPPFRDQWFAVKTLSKATVLKTRSGAPSVMTELTALSRLNSRFICNAYYAFQDEFNLYLVLDVCLGGDLRFNLNHAPRKRLSRERARFYTAQLVLALEYVHAQGYLHRDIKPDNLLLDADGNLKLTDFGVAKRPDNIDECTSSSGTHGYIAPEVYARGHVHGRQAEWFSMGVVLFELIVGKRPYPREELQRAHKRPNAVKKMIRKVQKSRI